MSNIKIDGKKIGDGFSPYVVAEISANHNGSIDRAKEIISAAKASGADAVKMQTYTPDTLTIDSNNSDFIIKGGLWDGYKLYDLYKEAYTPFEWHQELFEHAKSEGITCFSTPFDESAVDLLEKLNAPAYKIASFEAIDIPLIKYVAKTKKPMIISTGMADLKEIEEAVSAAESGGCKDLILLHCISAYPAPVSDSNLMTMIDLKKRFNVLTGLSDHTLGITVAVAASAMGACFIEKHFTLDRKEKGPDSTFSLEPSEMSDLCVSARSAWEAVGKAGYERKESEEKNIMFRRSIYFVKDIEKGAALTEGDIRRIRPGYGLKPKYYFDLIGRKVNRAIKAGEPVSWDSLVDN